MLYEAVAPLGKDYVTEWRTYIAEPLEREVGELRMEVKKLRDAIQRIDRCPHRDDCPVLDSLRKQPKSNGGEQPDDGNKG